MLQAPFRSIIIPHFELVANRAASTDCSSTVGIATAVPHCEPAGSASLAVRSTIGGDIELSWRSATHKAERGAPGRSSTHYVEMLKIVGSGSDSTCWDTVLLHTVFFIMFIIINKIYIEVFDIVNVLSLLNQPAIYR